jgi:hypothetical protein
MVVDGESLDVPSSTQAIGYSITKASVEAVESAIRLHADAAQLVASVASPSPAMPRSANARSRSK